MCAVRFVHVSLFLVLAAFDQAKLHQLASNHGTENRVEGFSLRCDVQEEGTAGSAQMNIIIMIRIIKLISFWFSE